MKITDTVNIRRLSAIVLHIIPDSGGYYLSDEGTLYLHQNFEYVKIEPVLTSEYPYWDINWHGTWIRVSCHRLMAYMFIPNPNPNKYKVVNHKNGDKQDWSAANLEWCTQSQNILHAQRHNLISTTTQYSTVVHICEAILQGKTNKEISNLFHVSQQLVCNIRNGRRHKQILEEVKNQRT